MKICPDCGGKLDFEEEHDYYHCKECLFREKSCSDSTCEFCAKIDYINGC